MSAFLNEHERAIQEGRSPNPNRVWCEWINQLNDFDRRAVMKHELHFFDAWTRGEMSFYIILREVRAALAV